MVRIQSSTNVKKEFFPFLCPTLHLSEPPLRCLQGELQRKKGPPFSEGSASKLHFNVGYQVLEVPKCSSWEDKHASGECGCLVFPSEDVCGTLDVCVI